MADGVGFEPTRSLHPRRFSRPVPSTARPPIHDNKIKYLGRMPQRTKRYLVPVGPKMDPMYNSNPSLYGEPF